MAESPAEPARLSASSIDPYLVRLRAFTHCRVVTLVSGALALATPFSSHLARSSPLNQPSHCRMAREKEFADARSSAYSCWVETVKERDGGTVARPLDGGELSGCFLAPVKVHGKLQRHCVRRSIR